MPCYVTQTMSVKLNMSSRDRIVQACKNVGEKIYKNRGNMLETFAVRFCFDTGKIEYDPKRVDDVNKIKREYSFLAVQEIAKKRKWAFKVKTKTISKTTLQLKKF